MYILECGDGSYYTGSTKDLELRLEQHMEGKGANYTRKRLPVKLLYFEEYQRIDEAYYREKQVQGWNRKKKEALIHGKPELLPELAIAYRDLNASETQPRPEEDPERSLRSPLSPVEGHSKASRRVLEGQFLADEISSESATPFGFENLSQLGTLRQRGALASGPVVPKSRPEAIDSRPEALEGQFRGDEMSSEPEHPFGFENLSRRDALEGQPCEADTHAAQSSNGQPAKQNSKKK